ncbi:MULTISPECIES: GNAT family N-acetyltransferase [unclassified Sphingomonas]|uniref:GNAT family N-acetyltransferase n=2 Tax=unclassified Sphingomonas TaxID=196159 RepID=UPI000A648181|nr:MULTISPECIES: GNAT family N-acetyltransferase [unclassified Sphingomonas]
MEHRAEAMGSGAIRPCAEHENQAIMAIINEAAMAYKGVIPADRWHDPYMPLDALEAEIAAGVRFTGYAIDGLLVGVMGIQSVRNVRLIRHAYVLSNHQGHGIGSALINHLRGNGNSPILIGTWAAAVWAIGFYRRHGFALVPETVTAQLLKTYWDVPERQIATSVVLAAPALTVDSAQQLIAAACNDPELPNDLR